MTRTLAGLGAAALLILALAACAAPASGTGSDTGTSSGMPDASGEAPATAPVVDGPGGCDLVTPELIQSTLGVAAGTPAEEASYTNGPPSCTYVDLVMNVQVTTDPDLYLPESTYDGHDLPGSVPVPATDRGYAVDGSLVVVKGDIGVFVTAFYSGMTVEQFLALATAIAGEL